MFPRLRYIEKSTTNIIIFHDPHVLYFSYYNSAKFDLKPRSGANYHEFWAFKFFFLQGTFAFLSSLPLSLVLVLCAFTERTMRSE